MKIALANLQTDYGGAEIHVLTLARGLQARGHVVLLFCHPDGRLCREAQADGVQIRPMRVRNQLAPVGALRMAAQLRRDRPDVAHLHTPRDYLCGFVAARMTRVPAVLLTRHMLRPLKPLMRRLYARADAVIYPSLRLRDLLLAQGLPPEKLHLIRGAIDLAAYMDIEKDDISGDSTGDMKARQEDCRAVQKLRQEWLGAEGELLIGCVGRLVVGKGQETLIEALAILRGRGRRFRLALIGDGLLRGALEAQSARLGVADAVCFAGFRDDIARVLRALDVVAVPSTLAELLPLSVMEAMAARRPVVAANAGGVPEIITDTGCGCLIPPGDANALADALETLAGDPALRARIGNAGAERIRGLFAMPRMIDETAALYERLVCRSR